MKANKIKELEQHYQLCEFSEEDCSECDKHIKGRIWYDRTSYEYDEGEYYCDRCAYRKLHQWDDFNPELYGLLKEGSEG